MTRCGGRPRHAGGCVSSDPTATDVPADAPTGRRGRRRWIILIAAVIVLDALAFILTPPFPKGGTPGEACDFPVCFIQASLEFPAPHTVIDLAPESAPSSGDIVTFHPSISSTLITEWIVIVLVVAGSALAVRGARLLPGRSQNVFEYV